MRIPHSQFNAMDLSKTPLVWDVGISRTEANFVQVHSPQMFLPNDEKQNLLVMKMGKIKIILGTKDVDISRPAEIQDISKGLKKKLIEVLKLVSIIPKDNPFFNESYVRIIVKTIRNNSSIDYEQRNIRSTDQGLVELNILNSHQFVNNYGENVKISFPAQNSYYIYFNHSSSLDEVLVFGSSKVGVSQLLQTIHPLVHNTGK